MNIHKIKSVDHEKHLKYIPISPCTSFIITRIFYDISLEFSKSI